MKDVSKGSEVPFRRRRWAHDSSRYVDAYQTRELEETEETERATIQYHSIDDNDGLDVAAGSRAYSHVTGDAGGIVEIGYSHVKRSDDNRWNVNPYSHLEDIVVESGEFEPVDTTYEQSLIVSGNIVENVGQDLGQVNAAAENILDDERTAFTGNESAPGGVSKFGTRPKTGSQSKTTSHVSSDDNTYDCSMSKPQTKPKTHKISVKHITPGYDHMSFGGKSDKRPTQKPTKPSDSAYDLSTFDNRKEKTPHQPRDPAYDHSNFSSKLERTSTRRSARPVTSAYDVSSVVTTRKDSQKRAPVHDGYDVCHFGSVKKTPAGQTTTEMVEVHESPSGVKYTTIVPADTVQLSKKVSFKETSQTFENLVFETEEVEAPNETISTLEKDMVSEHNESTSSLTRLVPKYAIHEPNVPQEGPPVRHDYFILEKLDDA